MGGPVQRAPVDPSSPSESEPLAIFPPAPLTRATPGRSERPVPNHFHRWALLTVYILAYGGFIGFAITAPGPLGVRVVGGVDLAVAWGFDLIVLAFVVALAALRLPEGR